jgi:type I restriction enzyme S subunit
MTDWQTKKLDDIAKIYDGTHQTPHYTDHGVPFYSVEQVTSNNFKNTKFIAENVYQKEIKRIKIEMGDVLMTRIGDIGTARYIDWDARASFYVSLALIKPGDHINGRFLSYVISSYYFQKELWKRSLTVAFPYKINLGDIGKSELLLPDLVEQKRIVRVLEVWDEYIDKLEQKIALKEQLKKGLMQQLLSGKRRLLGFDDEWIEVQLGDLGSARTSSVDKLSIQGEPPVRLLNYMDVYKRDHIRNVDTLQHVTAKNSQITASNLKRGDVLFTPSSETPIDIGHSAVVMEDLSTAVFSYHLMRLRPKANVLNHRFSAYCFKTYRFYKELWRRAQGATRFTLSKEALESSRTTIPKDVNEQEAIAALLENVDRELHTIQMKLDTIIVQKKYLLQKLLIGKIRTPEHLGNTVDRKGKPYA